MRAETVSKILAGCYPSKQADAAGGVKLPSVEESLQAMQNQDARREALRHAGKALLFGVGVGAGAKGVSGLLGLLQRQSSPVGPEENRTVFDLPYPDREDKRASVFDGLSDWLAGGSATTPDAVPWRNAAAITAGIGGAGLGWHAVDQTLDRIRASATDRDVAHARDEFHKALLSHYSDRGESEDEKAASSDVSELGVALDTLFDRYVADGRPKTVRAGDFGDTTGRLFNEYYAPVATVTGLAGLMAGWNAGSARSRRAMLQRAIERRARERYESTPPELYAIPVPVAKEEKGDKA